MKNIYILQGSNEGDRINILNQSLNSIGSTIGSISMISSLYESEPWGFQANQWFLNRVIMVKSDLEPLDVLERLMEIETQHGRTRIEDGIYHSRTLDLDILLIDDIILSLPNLTIPHPHFHKRRFTLLPLCEIIPDYIHPSLEKSILTLLNTCKDEGKVHVIKTSL